MNSLIEFPGMSYSYWHDLKVKNRGNITAEGILSIISGEKSQADPDLVESLKSLDTAFGKNTGNSPSD